MTHEELDVMWSIATRKSIEENQPYTRYEFAKLVAAKEREACAKVCETLKLLGPYKEVQEATLQDAAVAIRARGEA